MTLHRAIICMIITVAAVPWPPARAAELPHEFDNRVPLYAAARPVETRYTRNSATVHFSTEAPFAQVAAFYEQALPERGWRALPLNSSAPEGAHQRRFARGDVYLTLSPGSGTPASQTDFIIELVYPKGRE